MDFKIPFLGKVPLDPKIVQMGDSGDPILGKNSSSEAGKAFSNIVEKINENINKKRGP